MIFLRRRQRLRGKVLNSILDDFIEIENNCRDKNKFRNELIFNRLNEVKEKSMLSSSDINNMISEVSDTSMTYYQSLRNLKKVSNQLNAHYKTLLEIINKFK